MRPPKKPSFRLPAHLAHTRPAPARAGRPERDAPDPARPAPAAQAEPPDRIGQLLPELLRAMVGMDTEHTWAREAGTIVLDRAQILAALAPYDRPNSRFNQLVVRRLVGEGYLKPRGGLEKQGLSGQYALTPRGERLLNLRRNS
ncbi:hypothetical protein [Deinococcus maricopensis]|uniref:Uncharacterized protein n=1 Tax=Deinococcus maricopensis (strain DSM 21211 / LMG 22137 / NRRL B-23946 / LB-34) TaxID=709986 RepID=E8U3C7_DEIML|nr:hypothetical protein [Deinococcus maricopensis]ADV65798.1 hypothetical protein Deima_0134 [Deinococcus maricopensis DSM 21211]